MPSKVAEVFKSIRKNGARRLFVFVLLAIVAIVFLFGRVHVVLGDDALKISGTFAGNVTIPYDQIQSVELDENFDRGTRTFGVGTFTLDAGTFSNSEFGTYKLFSYSGCASCVVVTYADGVVAYNARTQADTQALYDALTAELP